MTNIKQDRNGVRTPVDVERRHKLGLIEKTAKEVGEIKEIDANFSSTSTRAVQNKVVTQAVNRLFNEKVDKVSGMTLSHNDYTDNDKYKVNNLDGHTHNNITVLNSITSQDIDNWNATTYEDYSLTEQVIGRWNGETLYRKVIYTTNITKTTTLNPNIQNLGIFTRVYGMVKRTNGYFNSLPCTYINWEIYLYDYSSDHMNVKFSDNQWNAGVDYLYVVMEYTKATS